MSGSPFFDTNVLLYLLSADSAKADRAEALIGQGGIVSVQVLNEFTATGIRKLRMSWSEIADVLDTVRSICTVVPLTVDTHDLGRALAQRYGFSVYDAMIVASALMARTGILYSEDLQDGLRVEGRLMVRNPFSTPKSK